MNNLDGVIDLHVHVGPSVAERIEDALEMYYEAEEAGYKAFIIKDHYSPSMNVATIIEEHLRKGETRVFGCLCLNNSVGGINLNAVDVACNMGAKIIFMPTVSAKNHIDLHKNKVFVGSGKLSVPEKPIYYLDENDNLKPEVIELLEYLSDEQPDVILGTGHGTAYEIDKLISKASKLNIKKILVMYLSIEIWFFLIIGYYTQ